MYKINCRQYDFVYYGQTERSLKNQVSEHKKAVLMFNENSKVASHVHQCHHQMDFDNVKVVGHEPNYHQQLFLEAWVSVKDTNAGNDHIMSSQTSIKNIFKHLMFGTLLLETLRRNILCSHANAAHATLFFNFKSRVTTSSILITDEGLRVSQ